MRKCVNNSRIIKSFLLVLMIIILFSCENDQSSMQDRPANSKILPKAYVIGVTEGNITSAASIRIDFSIDIELIKNGGDFINEDIFSFTPTIDGKVYWNGNSSLTFQPDSPLKNGKSYNGRVDLSKLFKIDDDQNKLFKFEINVIPMQLTIKTNELQPYPDKDLKFSFLTGKIISSDAIDNEQLANLITAEQDGKTLEIVFSNSDNADIKEFKVENIERKEVESKVLLKWNGGKIGSPDVGTMDIIVPSVNIFEFINIKVVNTPSQYVEIAFSDPIEKSLKLEGIVYLTEYDNVKYDIELNKVLIYTNSTQTGDAIVVIKKELRNTNGANLEQDYLKKIHFSQIMPAIKFIDDGGIMPGNENWLLHFEAVNLNKVDIIIRKIFADNVKQFLQVNDLDGNYQLDRVSKIIHKEQIDLNLLSSENNGNWNNYAIDLSNMIDEDEQGIYRIQLRFKKEYSLFDCTDYNDIDDEDSYYNYGYSNYYESEYYYPRGYRWSERDNPCSVSYYNYDRFIEKNVLASNIGLIVKGDKNNGYTVFATDLRTAEVIEGLEISVYDFQQQIITERITNSDGITTFHSKTEEPWLIMANRDGEFAYIKIKGGNSLSYSRFDTKGIMPNNGIAAFIYGDRGVWRPGDTLFLTMIAMNINDKLPENHPAKLKLYNPKSKIIVEKTLPTSINGFYSFVIATSPDDITGIWRAEFTLGGSSFSKRLRIENLKPNRLKISLNFDNKTLITDKNKATIKVRWLHGGIASGLKADITATLRTTNTIFDKYKEYIFNDIGRYFSPDEITVLDKKLNNKGELIFNVDLPPSKRAPGKLKVTFLTRITEKGGDFSISQDNMIYSPFDTYVGIKLPDDKGSSGYMEVDKSHRFNIATVDAKGNPVSVSKLQVEIYKISWSWWYGHRNGNSPDYIQSDFSNLVYSSTISSKNGKASFDFEISYPMWGNYYVKVFDQGSGHSCGTRFYMDWPSWYSREDRSAPGDASLLSLTADKKKYNVGDTVIISLPTPANSNMLVSLESNNTIINTWWQKTTPEESLIKFVATETMAPNIYAAISVIQPYGINQNDLPARMYGVIPIMIEDKLTVLEPVLSVPDEIRPNTEYNIVVTEHNNRKMTYTVAVVDDGLLDLTKFKTPAPHKFFYAKQALALRTWDLYDFVITAFKGNITRTFAIGGSDFEDDNGVVKKKANRFKPVVTFLGPFTLDAGQSVEHKIMMSNYVGSVRVMLVAGNDGAFGQAEKTIPVKQPLMVLTTIPRVLAPGESIVLPVSVFSMDENINKVSVKLITNDNFKAALSEKQIEFNQPGEKIVYFDVDVNDFDGVGEIRAVVTSGKESAYNEVEIQIRNPNPRTYFVKNFKVDKGKKLIYHPEFKGVIGSNDLTFSVSSMPQINLEKRLNYLIQYPYHCIEQTTSAAFPQLFLNEMTQLSDKQKEKSEVHISTAISRISKMQLIDGGFSYWPGRLTASDWGTTYAGHYLLKAQQKGYSISHSLLNNWKSYQKKSSTGWNPKYNSNGMINNDLTQAYRLFSLALAGSPNLGAMNRMREMKGLHIQAKYQLASAYAILGQKSVAQKLIANATYEAPVRNYWKYNYGSETRDKAMMVETLYLLDDDEAIPLVMDIAKDLRSNMWMSTQTTAFSLNAVSLFTQNNKADDTYSFKYKWDDGWSDEIIPVKPIYEKKLTANQDENLKFENTSDADVFVTITTSGIPALGEIMEEQKNLKLAVVYKDMDGRVVDITSLKHGTDFYAQITVTNPGKYGDIENLALSQLFPSGWEIINTRVFDIGAELKSDDADYTDYRDDGVNFFFSLQRGSRKKFIVLLNAAYRGKYFLPATQCGDMYNNNVRAVTGGGWVLVE